MWYTYIVRTRQIFPKSKQRKVSKYDYLVGTTLGNRKILRSLPRSLFEVECQECLHISFQRGDALIRLEKIQCQSCIVSNRDPNLNTSFLRTKNNAKTRSLVFNLTKKEYAEIAIMPCYYCGLEPERNKSNVIDRCPAYNGLDRVNPDIGYVKNNVVSSCKYCNYGKHDLSLEDFKSWITRCYNHTIRIDK